MGNVTCSTFLLLTNVRKIFCNLVMHEKLMNYGLRSYRKRSVGDSYSLQRPEAGNSN